MCADREINRLVARIADLEAENDRLRQEAAKYLKEWVAAQDLAYTRLVRGFLGRPATAGTVPAGKA